MADEVVGRSGELGALEPLLDARRDGLAALIFAGEAGIGKSTVWRAGVDLALEHRWLIVSSRPAASERSMTLGGLIDLLGGFDDAALEALHVPQRDALRVALLRADAEQPSATPDQRALSVAVAALLRDAARSETPLLIAIDDVQFLDESSAAILTYALRRLADRPIRLLAAIRTSASRGNDRPSWI